jgi:tRNA threonylcarbamoyladenosine modification (KEOPS) complex Cgi121 subunit
LIASSWHIIVEREDRKEEPTKFLGFGRGFRLPEKTDLRDFAKQLDEGIAICSSSYIAGETHIEAVLRQVAEYWARSIYLARNKSIDLLMRITCQGQISKALEASGLGKSKTVALFGITSSGRAIAQSENAITRLGAKREDFLLSLDKTKLGFLRKFHGLPSWVGPEDLPYLLSEKSVMLTFPK